MSRHIHHSTNRHRGLVTAQAYLAAMSRVSRINVGAGSAITTLRAGARTSGQTSMLGRALVGVRVAHPIMLFNLLWAHRIAMPRWIPRDRRPHVPWRRRVAAMRAARRRRTKALISSYRSAHPRAGKWRRWGMTVPSARRVRVRRRVTHPRRRHGIGARTRMHLVPVNSAEPVGRVPHHGVVHERFMEPRNLLHDAIAGALPSTTTKVSAEPRSRPVIQIDFRIPAYLAWIRRSPRLPRREAHHINVIWVNLGNGGQTVRRVE